MHGLPLVVGLMLAAVLLVGLGERIRLPWPALMVLLGVAVAVTPGLPDSFQLDPQLILPLFLPPLLYATAQRTSWAVFRARWRSIVLLAVALVGATVAVVAATAMALVPGITAATAIALGAIVAPPDPVAVEAVAGAVGMPRRLLDVLRSEGLFNDATSLVVFQVAIAAAVTGHRVSLLDVVWQFALGAAGAVLIGMAVAWLARRGINQVTTPLGRSALTLVLPFAVYLAAEEAHCSGVVAVVVLALQLRSAGDADEAEERLVQGAFWEVVELLVTGVAFGLVGLDLRQAAEDAGSEIGTMLVHAALVCAVVVGIRAVWLAAATVVVRRSADASAAPRTGREAVVLTWCGMRGLATLALALSLPLTTDSGGRLPARTEIVVIGCAVLVVTLLMAGFTLPTVVSALGVTEDADAEHAAERGIIHRASRAALDRMSEEEAAADLPGEVMAVLHQRMSRLEALLRGDPATDEDTERVHALQRNRDAVRRIQSAALAAARQEVLAARRSPGTDPEAADRVLHRLDQRTVMLD